MKQRIRDAGRRVARGVAPTVVASLESLPALDSQVAELRGQVAQLQARVDELDGEVQENRRLNRRLAELTDIVQELLLPVAQRDDEKVDQLLREYSAGL